MPESIAIITNGLSAPLFLGMLCVAVGLCLGWFATLSKSTEPSKRTHLAVIGICVGLVGSFLVGTAPGLFR